MTSVEDKRATFRMWPRQMDLLRHLEDPRVKTVLCVGAQQSGKTVGGAVAFCQHILRYSNDEFVLGAPTFSKLWDATLRKFLEWAKKFPDFIAKKNETKREIIFSNGSILFYRTYDQDLAAWEGVTARGAWIDEAQQMPLDIYRELLNRLTVKKGKLLITARVPDPQQLRAHWIYGLYQKALRDPKGPVRYVKFTAWDNPLYPQEAIEDKRRSLPAELFQAWVEGSMDVAARDDSLFRSDDIEAAFSRWGDAFARLPEGLRSFVWERGLSPCPDRDFDVDADGEAGAEVGVEEPLIEIGVDVAEYGGNMNVVAYRYGDCVFALENWGPGDLTATSEHIERVCNDLANRGFVPRVWVDATGIGASLPEMLGGAGVDVVPVKYGEKAVESDKYYNRKAEAFFLLRERLTTLALPPIEDLKEQLYLQKYRQGPTESGREDRLFVPKQDPSPDHLDALVFSCLGFETSVLPLYVA